ncbi:MAG: hypothetical protein ACLR2O_04675 [Coprococcus sp.]
MGGLAGAALLGALYALAINKWGGASGRMWRICADLFCWWNHFHDRGSCSICDQRNHEIKDYGKLIPDHGGILTVSTV